jgi:uncharacterized membrane protein
MLGGRFPRGTLVWGLVILAVLAMAVVVLSDDAEAVTSISLSIQGEDTQSVAPGSSATFKINITNTLTSTSLTVNLTYSTPPTGWTAQLSQSSVTVPALATRSVTLTVGVPSTAGADSVGKQIVVTATPDFGDTEQITTTTKVSQTYGIQTSTTVASKNTVGGSTVTFTMQINNTGNGADTVAITHTGEPSTWTVSHVSSSTVPAAGTRTVTITVVPPSNATAGTYQTTVKATSSDGTTNDQTTFIIVISKVYGLTLSSSDVSKYVTPNVPAYYNLSVTNTGNTGDNAIISIVNAPAGWTVLPTSNPVALVAGETKSFQVLVTAPNTALAGTQVQISVNATSNGNGSIVRTLSINAVVNQVYDPRVTPLVNNQVIKPGTSGTFKINVTNNGNGDDTVDMSLTGVPSGQGWVYNFNPVSVSLSSGETKTVDLSFTLGSKAAYGDNQITVIGTSHGTSSTGSTNIIVSVSQFHNLAMVPVGASTLRVDPGGSVDFNFSVTNTGNGPDDFTFAVLRMESAWVSYFTKTTVYNLPANGTETTMLTVEVPSTTNSGTYRFDVKATSGGNSSVLRTVFNITIIVNQLYSVDLEAGSLYYSGAPQVGVVVDLTVTNDGSGTDNFTMNVPGMYASWVTFNRTTVKLDPGTSTLVGATVTPPKGTSSGDYPITFRATSKGRVTVYDEAAVTYTVTDVYTPKLTAVEPTLNKKPTETAVFTVQLKNDGNTADTIKVNFSTNTRGLASHNLASPFVILAAGQTRTFTVTVTVPANEPVGNLRFVLLATSDNDTASTSTVTLTLVVDPVHAVNLFSYDATATAEPTDSDTVELRVENTGNGQDTYRLRAIGPYYTWVTFEATTVMVGAGGEMVVNMTVTIPDSDVVSTGTYTINITATSTTDSGATSLLAVKVTVKHKEDLALSAADLIRRRSTDPGGTVTYRIDVENLGVNAHVVNLDLGGANADWANLDKSIVVLQGGASTEVKVTVDVPDGTAPTTFDLTITGTFDDNEMRTDTFTVITTVNRVNGVEVELNDTTVSGAPGQTVTVTFNVNNTGNDADTFDLSVDVNKKWVSISPASVTLAAGANTNVTVRVVAPIDPLTPAGLVYLNVTATSRGNTSVSAADMLEMDVEQVYAASIKVSPLRQSVDPGTNALYNVTVTNDGNGRDTFILSMEGARKAWGRLSATQVTLDAGEERIVVLTVRIPSNQPVEDAVVMVNATSSGGDDVTVKATTTTTINPFYGVTLTISNDEKPALPGRYTVFTVKVKNTGNSQDTFNFAVTGDYESWVAEMAPLTIDAGKTKNLEVNITPPIDVANGDYTFTINGSSDTVGDAFDMLDLMVHINVYYRMSVSLGETEINSSPDATETALVFVENTGNVNDTFDVRVLGQYASWVSVDNTTLDADEGATAVATATIDVNTTRSGNYVIRFEVTSHGGGNVTEVQLTIIIDLRYGVSLVAVKEAIPSGNNMSVDAEVELTNEGNTEDTYTLKVVGLPGSLWDAQLQVDELTVMGGEVGWFNVTVDVPPGVKAGNYVVQVRATSTMSPVALAKTIPLNITVAFGVNATGPADKVNVMPGDERIVQVTVENTGLGPDIIGLAPTAAFEDWADPVQSAVMLMPGESTIVDVLITPPEGELTGTYVVQIRATSSSDTTVTSVADVRVGVGQVYDILVEPASSSVEGPVSVWHDVDLTITNLGNGEDTITLDAIVPGGIAIESSWSNSIVILAGGADTEVTLRLRADKDMEAGAYVIDVTARSSSSSVSVYHVDVTFTIPEVLSVDVKTDSGLDEANIVDAVIGKDYQVTFEVFNLGNTDDTYGISTLSENTEVPSWFSFDAGRVTVPSGESRMMIATISVPSDTLAGLYSFDIQIKSESANVSALLAGSVEVSTYRSVTISTDDDEATVDPSGATGDSAKFVFDVRNEGNMAETVTLEVSYPNGWGLPVITPESIKVDPFSETTVTLEFPPSSVPASAAAINSISVKARYGAFETAVTPLTVRVLKPDVSVLSVATSVNSPKDGDLVDVTITLKNSGQVDATGLTVILLANEVEVGRVQGQTVSADSTRDVLITWDVDESPGTTVILKVRVPDEDITYSHPTPVEVKEAAGGFFAFFEDMSFYMLIAIGLVLGLILGLFVAAAVRSGTKRRLADAHAAGMAEGMALAAEAEEEKEKEKEEEPEPEEEADGDEDEYDEDLVPMGEGDEGGEMEEDVAPVVVQCPQCDTYNNVTTSQRPYEFRCEKCNALLRLKE